MAKVKKSGKKKLSTDRPTISEGDFSIASDGLLGNRVFVSLSKTINIGNYESIRVEYGVGRTIPDGHEFGPVIGACRDEVATNLQEMVKIVEMKLK